MLQDEACYFNRGALLKGVCTSTVEGRALSCCVTGSKAARNSVESHLRSSSTL